MIMRRLMMVAGIGAAAMLAGCDGGGGDDGGGTGGGGTAAEDSFGATFSMAFDADPTAEPANPGRGDLPPVDPTADPVDF